MGTQKDPRESAGTDLVNSRNFKQLVILIKCETYVFKSNVCMLRFNLQDMVLNKLICVSRIYAFNLFPDLFFCFFFLIKKSIA